PPPPPLFFFNHNTAYDLYYGLVGSVICITEIKKCQRLRDSGFIYIKTYVFGTLAVYIISIITMIAEDFACSGNGSMIFLICYFSTFSMLMLAPTDSSKQ
uniref:hypothetical protein n=1 Tax=Escherichia coli TaxID=562 RepID=UPI00201AB5CD